MCRYNIKDGEIRAYALIVNHMDGILAFWRNDRLTNAHMEGFHNKIRWLIRQAYGYRDREYFYLKIYDLPKLKTTKEL